MSRSFVHLTTVVFIAAIAAMGCERKDATPIAPIKEPVVDKVEEPVVEEPGGDAAVKPTGEVSEVSREFKLLLAPKIETPALFKALDALPEVSITPALLEEGVDLTTVERCKTVMYYDTAKRELAGEKLILRERQDYEKCTAAHPKPITNSERATLEYRLADEPECVEDKGLFESLVFGPLRGERLEPSAFRNDVGVTYREASGKAFQQTRGVEIAWKGDDRDTDKLLRTSFHKFFERRFKGINTKSIREVCGAPLWQVEQPVGTVKVGAAEVELIFLVWAERKKNALEPALFELAWRVKKPEGEACAEFDGRRESEEAVFSKITKGLASTEGVELLEGNKTAFFSSRCR